MFPESDWRKYLFVCPVISVGSMLLFRKNSLPDHVKYLHLLNKTLHYVLIPVDIRYHNTSRYKKNIRFLCKIEISSHCLENSSHFLTSPEV